MLLDFINGVGWFGWPNPVWVWATITISIVVVSSFLAGRFRDEGWFVMATWGALFWPAAIIVVVGGGLIMSPFLLLAWLGKQSRRVKVHMK